MVRPPGNFCISCFWDVKIGRKVHEGPIEKPQSTESTPTNVKPSRDAVVMSGHGGILRMARRFVIITKKNIG